MEKANIVSFEHSSLADLLQLQKDIQEELKKRAIVTSFALPLSIFHNQSLAPLEVAVSFLKKKWNLSYQEIANLLHRTPGCIGLTYRNALKKDPQSTIEETGIAIPIDKLNLKHFSLLESVVAFLKPNFSLHQIAVLLQRDDRTIWTLAKRAEGKLHA